MRTGCVALVCIGVGLAGCAAATGARVNESERTVEARTENREVEYRFGPVPQSWERVRIDSNDAAWHDSESRGLAHVDSSCGRDQDTPLPSLVQQLLIGFTERTFELEETVPFDGREARHVRVLARLDGVPMRMELYVLKKNGCVFDLGFVAPPDSFARGAAGFDSFARGFRTVDTGGAAALGVRPEGR